MASHQFLKAFSTGYQFCALTLFNVITVLVLINVALFGIFSGIHCFPRRPLRKTGC
jgi:hypothetical protein